MYVNVVNRIKLEIVKYHRFFLSGSLNANSSIIGIKKNKYIDLKLNLKPP